MPKFAKRFLFVCAALLIAAAIVLLIINIYLQSSGVQQRIRTAASRALGAEISVGSTSYTPWNGLVLRDIKIPEPNSTDRMMVEATALRLRFALFPLFGQRFVVTECSLFEPKLTVRQMATGDWLVPLPPARTPEISVAPSTDVAPSAPIKGPSFKAELQFFRLTGATLTFIDAKGHLILFAERCDIDARIDKNLSATGSFEVGRAEIAGALKPRHVKGPFSWDGKALDLSEIKGQLASGEILGKCRIETGENSMFDLSLQLNEILLKRLFSDANLSPGKTEGQLKGTLSLKGDPKTSSSLEGTGHFELVNAKLKPVEFLSKIGEVLGIDELRLLQLKDATIDLTVHDERVQVSSVLSSENLELTGSGPIRFNGKMNIDAKLRVNRKIQRQLQGVLSRNFVATDDPEYRQVAFSITGKIDNPKTDLVDKVIGMDVGGLFKSLFRAPSPRKSNDTPAPEPSNN
ncbi:hypothetical protein BH09VER1_BH09VER1_11380 [soil metagenome]